MVVVLLPWELRQLSPHGVRVGHGAGPGGHASHGGVAEEHGPGQPRGVGQHRGGREQGRDGSSLDSYSKDSYSKHFLAGSTDSRVWGINFESN